MSGDEEVFDRMFARAKHQLQAKVRLGRAWRFEAILVAVLLEHEQRMGEMLGKLEELKASPPL